VAGPIRRGIDVRVLFWTRVIMTVVASTGNPGVTEAPLLILILLAVVRLAQVTLKKALPKAAKVAMLH